MRTRVSTCPMHNGVRQPTRVSPNGSLVLRLNTKHNFAEHRRHKFQMLQHHDVHHLQNRCRVFCGDFLFRHMCQQLDHGIVIVVPGPDAKKMTDTRCKDNFGSSSSVLLYLIRSSSFVSTCILMCCDMTSFCSWPLLISLSFIDHCRT